MSESLLAFLSTARRSWETSEPYWFWELGPYDVSAGFFKGFGLGFDLMPGEWSLVLGSFSVGGVIRV